MRVVWLVLATWVALCGSAMAEGLADCKGEAFKAALKLKSGYDYDCQEVLAQASPVEGGWTIRVLRNASTDQAQILPYAETGAKIVAKAFEAWKPYASDLGLKFRNVTIVFVDPVGSEIDFVSKVHGLGESEFDAHTDGYSLPDECIIMINTPQMTQRDVSTQDLTFAHELFHCVMFWSYLPAHSAGPDAHWWQEGSANLFASMVVSNPPFFDNLGVQFLGAIEVKPLTQQAYNSIVFFAWLWQQGPGTMAAFYKALPTEPGELQQMQAVEKALGEDLLQKFAEAVVDGTVTLPSGQTFPALENPEVKLFEADGEFTTSTTPFTIDTRLIKFVGGSYVVAQTAYEARLAAAGEWGPMPNRVEPSKCKEPVEFLATRFVGTSIMDAAGMPFIVGRYAECHICQDLPENDQCLVGTWRLRQDSMLSYLQKSAQDKKDVRYSSVAGNVSLVVAKDGSAQWVSEGLQVEAVVSIPEIQEEVDVRVQADGILSGRWSSGASTMHFCAESQDMDFTSKVKFRWLDEDVVTTTTPLEDTYLTYKCHPKVLTVIYSGPAPVQGAAPTWTLDRIK